MRPVIFFAVCTLTAFAMVAHADDGEDRKTMLAASVSLSFLTFPYRTPIVQSGVYAESPDRQVTYKKVGNCVFTLEEGHGNGTHIELVDFSALTGAYTYSPHLISGVNQIFQGRKPETRCFVIGGRKSCQSFFKISTVPSGEVQRVVNDVMYILRHACPPASPQPF